MEICLNHGKHKGKIILLEMQHPGGDFLEALEYIVLETGH